MNDSEILDLIEKRTKIYSKAQFKINCHKLKKTEIVEQILKIYESNQYNYDTEVNTVKWEFYNQKNFNLISTNLTFELC